MCVCVCTDKHKTHICYTCYQSQNTSTTQSKDSCLLVNESPQLLSQLHSFGSNIGRPAGMLRGCRGIRLRHAVEGLLNNLVSGSRTAQEVQQTCRATGDPTDETWTSREGSREMREAFLLRMSRCARFDACSAPLWCRWSCNDGTVGAPRIGCWSFGSHFTLCPMVVWRAHEDTRAGHADPGIETPLPQRWETQNPPGEARWLR